jgi:hypothetical protein
MHREKSVALSDAKRTLPLHNHAYRLADYQGVFDASVDAMHNAVSRESSLLMQVVFSFLEEFGEACRSVT